MKRKTKAWRRARQEARTRRHEMKRRAKRKAMRRGVKTKQREEEAGVGFGIIRRTMQPFMRDEAA